MRVSLLTETTEWGGAEKFTAELARVLLERGHDVTLVCLGDAVFADRVPGGVQILHAPTPAQTDLLNWRQIKRLLQPCEGDVGLFVKGWFLAGSWRFDLCARQQWARYYVVEQAACALMPSRSTWGARSSPSDLGPLRWWKQWAGRAARAYLARKTVAVSASVATRLVSEYRYPASRIVIAANGAAAETFIPDANRRSRARALFGCQADNDFIFGVVGRLSTIKRVDRVISALHDIRQVRDSRGRRARLVIVGSGPEHAALESLVHRLGLAEDVSFLPYTPTPEQIYPGLDALVLASDNEGLPLSVCEAMACEVIPVLSAVGGNPELVGSPPLGRLFRPGDHADLVEAMTWALNLPSDEMRVLGAACRNRVVEHFSLSDQIRRVADLLEA